MYLYLFAYNHCNLVIHLKDIGIGGFYDASIYKHTDLNLAKFHDDRLW